MLERFRAAFLYARRFNATTCARAADTAANDRHHDHAASVCSYTRLANFIARSHCKANKLSAHLTFGGPAKTVCLVV